MAQVRTMGLDRVKNVFEGRVGDLLGVCDDAERGRVLGVV